MRSSASSSSSSGLLTSRAIGRFVFPPGSPLTPESKLKTLEGLVVAKQEIEAEQIREEKAIAAAEEKERLAKERAWQKYLKLEDHRRREREKCEREEALKGEKHWVRQGGVLWDADGRKDYKRTEEIRRIVQKEDAERRIMERWRAYENAWTNIILSTNKAVTFADMPWPVASPPRHPDELRNPPKVADFLFESLSLDHIRTTRRERLRTSLLRWHPDKLSGLLARVPENELDAVRAGIDAVVISLMKLQEAEKTRR